MGFWKKLFGLEGKKKAEFNVFAVDKDGDGKVQDGTIWERPAELSVDLDKTLEKAEKLLQEVAPAVKPKAKTKAAPTKKPATKAKSAPKKADPKKAKPKATTPKKKK